jgi:hypothetical protein
MRIGILLNNFGAAEVRRMAAIAAVPEMLRFVPTVPEGWVKS